MRSLALLIATTALIAARPADAQVSRGPHPNTVQSRGGELVWYVGQLDLTGRHWRDADRICAAVPVPAISGWRAPTMAELETLMREQHYQNAAARWTRLFFWNEALMWPAVPPYEPQARSRPQLHFVSRDVYTYEGRPTTLAAAERGKLYIIHWFDRWTQPFLGRGQSIRYDPGGMPFGRHHRLLCMAER